MPAEAVAASGQPAVASTQHRFVLDALPTNPDGVPTLIASLGQKVVAAGAAGASPSPAHLDVSVTATRSQLCTLAAAALHESADFDAVVSLYDSIVNGRDLGPGTWPCLQLPTANQCPWLTAARCIVQVHAPNQRPRAWRACAGCSAAWTLRCCSPAPTTSC